MVSLSCNCMQFLWIGIVGPLGPHRSSKAVSEVGSKQIDVIVAYSIHHARILVRSDAAAPSRCHARAGTTPRRVGSFDQDVAIG